MKNLTFRTDIPTAVIDNTRYILTSDEEMAALESGIRSKTEQLGETEAKLAEWAKETAKLKKGEKGSVEQAEIDRTNMQAVGLRMDIESLRQGLEKAQRIRKKVEDQTEIWRFDMHCYSFTEQKQAQDAATVFGIENNPIVKNADYMLNILFQCMETWSLEPDITIEEIGNLGSQVVNTLFGKLQMRSEPSEQRLDFLA